MPGGNEKKFNKSEYNKAYNKENYEIYVCNMKKEESKAVEEFRLMKNMTKSELVKEALLYYIDHH